MLPYFPHSPIKIRDEAYERVSQITSFKNVFKAFVRPLKDEDLPCAVISHGGETATHMGDANCGPPEFEHTFKLEIDVVAAAGNGAALDERSGKLHALLLNRLFRDPTFIEKFESIEGYDTKVTYAPLQEGGANFMVHINTTIELTYRSIWEPNIPNWFETLAVSAFVDDEEKESNPFYTEYEVFKKND